MSDNVSMINSSFIIVFIHYNLKSYAQIHTSAKLLLQHVCSVSAQ